MSIEVNALVEENDQYTLAEDREGATAILNWKFVRGLGPDDFRTGILALARHCAARRSVRAVIDAAKLDFESPAVAWLQGQSVDGEPESYNDWWLKEVVPLYNQAGLASLAVGTGNPNAPGELTDLPAAVEFRVAYLADLDAALAWNAP